MTASPILRTLPLAALLLAEPQPARAQIGDAEALLGAYRDVQELMAYDAYMVVSAFADAYEGAVYEPEQVMALLEEQVEAVEKVIHGLEKVNSSSVLEDSGDRARMDDMIRTLREIRIMAMTYKSFAGGAGDQARQHYEEARSNAWAGIKALREKEE